jgi:3-deoxy-manno-octulosonate cytidylyltransferase (CMP-KDO synthetase)
VLLFVVPPVAFRDPFERTSQPPQVIAVIPARYQSTRFPGKPLADLAGRPMIEHVYRRTAAARGVEAVVVATDDERIRAVVERFGGVARMTRESHRSGTDRIAEAIEEVAADIVVNVQGDEPLIEPAMIEEVIEPLKRDGTIQMSTLCRRITALADYDNPNVVKVVTDRNGDALYFSRSPLPFVRSPRFRSGDLAYKHIGLYGYRRAFLRAFAQLEQTPLEISESLEQLRALEYGFRIRTVETQYDSIGVDTPEDLERVRHQLAAEARA